MEHKYEVEQRVLIEARIENIEGDKITVGVLGFKGAINRGAVHPRIIRPFEPTPSLELRAKITAQIFTGLLMSSSSVRVSEALLIADQILEAVAAGEGKQ